MKSGCTGWLKGRPRLTIECVLTNIVCGVGGQGVLLAHWQPLSEHHVSRLGVMKRKPLLQCVCVGRLLLLVWKVRLFTGVKSFQVLVYVCYMFQDHWAIIYLYGHRDEI